MLGEAEEINNENLSTANGKSFSQNVNRKLDLPSQNDVNTGLQNNIMNNQKEFSSYLNNQPNIVKHSKSRFNDDLNLKPTFFPRIKHNKKNFEDKSLNNYEKNQMFNQNDKMDEFPSIDLVQKERGEQILNMVQIHLILKVIYLVKAKKINSCMINFIRDKIL